jgi:hypothetical protein
LSAGPQLGYTLVADTSNFSSNFLKAQQSLQQFNVVKEGTNQNLFAFQGTLNKTGSSAGALTGSTRSASVSLSQMASAMMTVGSLGRQVIGMYTQWNVWQIRLIQYQSQLLDSLKRQAAQQREVIRVDKDLGQITFQIATQLQNMAKAAVLAPTAFNDLRRATGDTIIAIGRFGPQSDEAAAAVANWEGSLISWGEKAREMGVPLGQINAIMNVLTNSIKNGQIPNWRALGEEIGWNAEQFGPLGTFAMNANSVIDMATKGIQEDFKNTATDQEKLNKLTGDWKDTVENTRRDIVADMQKIAAAEQEARLQGIAFGLEVVGMAGQVIMLVTNLGLLSAACGGLAACRGLGGLAGGIGGGIGGGGTLGGLAPAGGGVGEAAVSIGARTLPYAGMMAAMAPVIGYGISTEISGQAQKDREEAAKKAGWNPDKQSYWDWWLGGGQYAYEEFKKSLPGQVLTGLGAPAAGLRAMVGGDEQASRRAIEAATGLKLPGGQFGIEEVSKPGPYVLGKGEKVTPVGVEAPADRLMSIGNEIGESAAILNAAARTELGGATEPSQITYHYSFGDIIIQVQQVAREEDMRTVALRLRRHIQNEIVRVPGGA